MFPTVLMRCGAFERGILQQADLLTAVTGPFRHLHKERARGLAQLAVLFCTAFFLCLSAEAQTGNYVFKETHSLRARWELVDRQRKKAVQNRTAS